MSAQHATRAAMQRNDIERGVTLNRTQFLLMRLALAQYVHECRTHAGEAARCGMADYAADWTKDAEKFQALLHEVEGL
ncbi:hypothetical protein FEE59_03060 [Herbaspirillum sp. RU 5E]|nr:hypothetical protein [Herbaspirillum sp. RU 5E]